jgi:hypothetical protein
MSPLWSNWISAGHALVLDLVQHRQVLGRIGDLAFCIAVAITITASYT